MTTAIVLLINPAYGEPDMVSFIVMFEQIWQGFISNIKKKKKQVSI